MRDPAGAEPPTPATGVDETTTPAEAVAPGAEAGAALGDDERLARAEAALGVRFRDRNLLRRALTHRSFTNPQWSARGRGAEGRRRREAAEAPAGEAPAAARDSNERLEFLGDAVLGFLVADTLYRRFPDAPEGELTARRVALIRTDTLAHWARQLGLGPLLYINNGEEVEDLSDRVLANAFEAVLAAIYGDAGLDVARGFLEERLVEADAIIARLATENYKGRLQELVQDPEWHQAALGLDEGRHTPVYVVVARGAPATEGAFTVEARLDDRAIGVGEGSNKRLAEQAAARDALLNLGAAGEERAARAAGQEDRDGAEG